MADINAIRKANGQPELTANALYVYPKVVAKLQAKRVAVEKLTPDKVADIAFSAIHNAKSKVISTKFPQIQALIALLSIVAHHPQFMLYWLHYA